MRKDDEAGGAEDADIAIEVDAKSPAAGEASHLTGWAGAGSCNALGRSFDGPVDGGERAVPTPSIVRLGEADATDITNAPPAENLLPDVALALYAPPALDDDAPLYSELTLLPATEV